MTREHKMDDKKVFTVTSERELEAMRQTIGSSRHCDIDGFSDISSCSAPHLIEIKYGV